MHADFAILTGTANPALAAALAERLGTRLSPCQVERFPDGEVAVQLLEPVRHKTVFLVQPTSPPVNDHLIELLALADACRRAAALQRSMTDGSMSELKWTRLCVRAPPSPSMRSDTGTPTSGKLLTKKSATCSPAPGATTARRRLAMKRRRYRPKIFIKDTGK